MPPVPKPRSSRTFKIKIGVALGHASGIRFPIVGWQQVSRCAFLLLPAVPLESMAEVPCLQLRRVRTQGRRLYQELSLKRLASCRVEWVWRSYLSSEVQRAMQRRP